MRYIEIVALLVISWTLIGCQKPSDKQAPPVKDAHDHGSTGEGAAFEKGKGITLMEETRKALGLEFADVVEEVLTPSVSLTAQIYRSATEVSRKHGRERSGFAYATALVSSEIAAQLKPGQKLLWRATPKDDLSYQGQLIAVDLSQIPLINKAEVLLELSDATSHQTVGDFVQINISSEAPSPKVVAIPRSAVLETSTGTFVFVKNGTFLLRTEIKTGIENRNSIEITDGLYSGDTIAVKPVEALYMIELRATKGGGHCH